MIALRPLTGIAIAVLALLIVLYAGWRLFGDGPRRDAAVARGQAALDAADDRAAHQAIETLQANTATEAVSHETTRSNHVTIIQTPGAAALVPPAVDAAGRRAVCLRRAAAGLAACTGLRDAHP